MALTSAGNVVEGYVNSMLAREQQTSTFLGNGIVISHGTTDTRDLVQKTDLQVFQFPQALLGARRGADRVHGESASPRNLTSSWRCCAN